MITPLSRKAVWALATCLVGVAADSTKSNPDPTDIRLTTSGSDWLWAAFAVMLFSDLIFIGWHFSIPRGERVFHQIPIVILTTASIAYFGLASNLGHTGIPVEFRGSPMTRDIWYVRYIDWVITTPMLLLELLLGTGMGISDLLVVIFFDVAMIVVGLVGALVISQYKWGFWTLGMFFEFYIWYVLLGPARNTAGLHGAAIKKAYTKSALILSSLWLLYPVCWALADGGNVITVTGEMVFYGVLDILAKPVFCFIHVWALRSVPYAQFQYVSVDPRVAGSAANPAKLEKGQDHVHGPMGRGSPDDNATTDTRVGQPQMTSTHVGQPQMTDTHVGHPQTTSTHIPQTAYTST